MSLPPGARLGVYDVIALIGTGGMGEVYRARDARLQRHVAMKAPTDLVSASFERVARLEREAPALATLSHPNVAVIHGIEEVAGAAPGQGPVTALILEMVEGERSPARLERIEIELTQGHSSSSPPASERSTQPSPPSVPPAEGRSSAGVLPAGSPA